MRYEHDDPTELRDQLFQTERQLAAELAKVARLRGAIEVMREIGLTEWGGTTVWSRISDVAHDALAETGGDRRT